MMSEDTEALKDTEGRSQLGVLCSDVLYEFRYK